MMHYDYIVVGSGLFGAIFAHEAHLRHKKVLVLEKRNHIGGNIYTKEMEGIQVHMYGAHIFHTSNKDVWDYMNQFTTFNRYTNSPIAYYKGQVYNMPFNMNTFNKMWGVVTPQEAKAKIKQQILESGIDEPTNLEEQAIKLVGRDIYEVLVKGYTAKQWGKACNQLPPFIIKRLPVRFTYDNNYFNDTYQGIPIGGYTSIIEKMLEGVEVRLNCDFLENKEQFINMADKVIYTGMIDAFYDHCYGYLEYRSLRFENEVHDIDNYQGNAVVNYNEYEIPYTRIIEHKHFEFGTQPKTVITKEYPATWKPGDEPYYPLNDEKNNALYEKYKAKAKDEPNIIFGGRLGMYQYFDMHHVVASALQCVHQEFDEQDK